MTMAMISGGNHMMIVNALFFILHIKYTVQSQAEDAQRHKHRGITQLHSGSVSNAIESLLKASELDPDDHDCLHYLAIAYMTSNKIKLAQKHLETVVVKKHRYVPARSLLAEILQRQGHYDASIEHLHHILDHEPDNSKARSMIQEILAMRDQRMRALKLMEAGRYLDALTIFDHLFVANDMSAELYEKRAECQEKLKNHDAAIADYKKLLVHHQDRVDIMQKIARLLFRFCKFKEAKTYIRMCHQQDLENAACSEIFRDIKYVEKTNRAIDASMNENKYHDAFTLISKELDSMGSTNKRYAETKPHLLKTQCRVSGKLGDESAIDTVSICSSALDQLGYDDIDSLKILADAHIVLENYDTATDAYKRIKKAGDEPAAEEGMRSLDLIRKNRGRKDYYKILGVKRSDGEAKIKSAYLEQVKKWHPDNHQKDKNIAETKFKDIQQAKEILMDPDKRARYDHGEDFDNPESQGHRGGGGNPFNSFFSFPQGSFFRFQFQ